MTLFKTLRFRLAFFFILFLSLIAGIVLTILLNRIETRLRETIDFAMEEHIYGIAEIIGREADEADEHYEEHFSDEFWQMLEDEIFEEALHSQFQEEAYFVLNEEENIIIHKTLSDKYSSITAQELEAVLSEGFATLELSKIGAFCRAFTTHKHDYKIIMITSLEDYQSQVNWMRFYFISAALVLILLGGMIAWITIGKSMDGVQKVSDAANRFGQGDLDQRVDWNGKGSEIENLVHRFNEMASQTQSLINELGEVTNNIAHDLRTPVTRMRGLAENSLDSLEGNQELALSVIEECERQSAIIEDILSLSESESGTMKLNFSDTSLNDLLTDIHEIYLPLAEREQANLELILPKEPVIAKADTRCLKRVIANLIDNALKYAKGHITLILSQNDKDVEIRIKDKGPGIPQEYQKKVFERFFRVDKSRNTEGSGLGLSLARSYIKCHKGSLTLESCNSGACFLIQLPND